ncbi:hypothetical protein GCM10027612_07300 [Microbispora bryophytorum subsp. camponoti]
MTNVSNVYLAFSRAGSPEVRPLRASQRFCPGPPVPGPDTGPGTGSGLAPRAARGVAAGPLRVVRRGHVLRRLRILLGLWIVRLGVPPDRAVLS